MDWAGVKAGGKKKTTQKQNNCLYLQCLNLELREKPNSVGKKKLVLRNARMREGIHVHTNHNEAVQPTSPCS